MLIAGFAREILSALFPLADWQMDCNAHGCVSPAVIILGGRGVCLEHFFSSCYEQLDTLELKLRTRSLDHACFGSAKTFLQECSNRTLLICLRNEHLSNLERSRLLDILLSCGDLQSLLRRAQEYPKLLSGHTVS